jgi:hypothetical protein
MNTYNIKFIISTSEINNFFLKIPKNTIKYYFKYPFNYYFVNMYENKNIDLLNKIKYCVKISHIKIIKNLDVHLLCCNDWNICVYNNFMFNLPFTYDNIIYLPYELLLNMDNSKLIELLIHEKIHIFQRFNINWIDSKYINMLNWKQINVSFNYGYLQSLINSSNIDDNIDDNIVDNVVDNIVVFNPDTIDCNYTFMLNDNNKLYYCVLYLQNENVNYKWFEYINNKLINTDFTYSYDHLYEELAYKISKNIA